VCTAAAADVWSVRPGFFSRPAPPISAPVAVVEAVEGTPRRLTDASGARADIGVLRNDPLHPGDWITTDSSARLALRFSDGTSVRMDVGSRARPLSSSVIELSAGAVYVDTGRESGRFEVRTPVATALDIGTQFEIRLIDRTLRLRVRSGVVTLTDRGRSVTGREGTEITLSEGAAVSRAFPSYGPDWHWAARLSPRMDIEGMALDACLERIAREQGWSVRYADPALSREAAGIILHGSVEGLPAREALEVALTTSGLRHRLEGGQLVVMREPGPR
jgi:ferric-dicitrate binding protein FerR (iron transport regulator)